MDESPKEFDIAITFAGEDMTTADALRESLSANFSVFLYTTQQIDLAGTDGLASLRRIFREESRLVVILLGKSWGTTQWTRVEEEAITDRFLKEGPDFLFIIVTDHIRAIPPWLPDKLLRFSLRDFGLEQAVGAIKARALERGSHIQRRGIASWAESAQKRIEFEAKRKNLIHSEAGVRDAIAELKALFKIIAELAKEAGEMASGLALQVGVKEEVCVVKARRVGFSLGYSNHIVNSIDEAVLFMQLQRGLVLLPSQYRGNYFGNTEILQESHLRPDIDRVKGWGWVDSAGAHLTSLELAETLMERLLKLCGSDTDEE